MDMQAMDLLESLLPAATSPDERRRVVACYESRRLLASLVADCLGAEGKLLDTAACRPPAVTCPLGQFASVIDGERRCGLCPLGAFCPAAAVEPQLCPPGTTTAARGASSAPACQCAPGQEAAAAPEPTAAGAAGPPVCQPCPAGTFKRGVGNGRCLGRCPPRSTSRAGTADPALCECEPGFYLSRLSPWSCTPCPDGAACGGGLLAGGVTGAVAPNGTWLLHQPPVALQGFFGYRLEFPSKGEEAYEPVFRACTIPGLCAGNNECTAGSAGPSCQLCQQGYLRQWSDGACRPCTPRVTLYALDALKVCLALPAYVLAVRTVGSASRDRDVLSPMLLKILYAFVQGTSMVTLVFLNPGAAEDRGQGFFAVVDRWLRGVLRGAASFRLALLPFPVTEQLACTGERSAAMSGTSTLETRSKYILWVRAIETVLLPVVTPLAALVILLPFAACRCRQRSRGFAQKMRSLRRMQHLMVHEEGRHLYFAQSIVADTRGD